VTQTGTATVTWTVDCQLTNFAPSQAGTFSGVVALQAPTTDFSDFRLTFNFNIGSQGVQVLDPRAEQGSGTLIVCGKLSTLPGCK
jgi:hypothetical protein